MQDPERMSFTTKMLWAAVPIVGAFTFAAYKFKEDLSLRYPTDQEQHQLDNILRPAAVDAARAALTLYMENPSVGFIGSPPDSLPQPQKATELYVKTKSGKKKYTVIADMQKKDGKPNAESVYDITIFRGNEQSGLYISSIDFADSTMHPDLLFAETHGDTVDIDLGYQSTDSEIKQAMTDAKKVAAEARADVRQFDKHNS